MDIVLRQNIVDSGFIKFYKKLLWRCFLKEESAFNEFESIDFNIAYECGCLLNNSHARSKRLKRYVMSFLNMSLYEPYIAIFATFTFNECYLSSTTKDTRKQRIRRFLLKNCFSYIANIDYGKEKEREHYHAIILVEPSLLKKERDKKGHLHYVLSCYDASIGFCNVEPILLNRNIDLTATKLSRYINKLSNHAIKATTKNNRVIYCRNVSKIYNKYCLFDFLNIN